MIQNSPFDKFKARRTHTQLRTRRMQLLSLAGVLLLVGAVALWRAPLSGALWQILRPVVQMRFGGTAGDAQNASTAAALADRDALYAENLDLKKRLGRAVVVPRIVAGVLLRPPMTPYDTLVIDAGSAEGVTAGDFVSAGGTALVGTVSDVYARSARVALFSAPGGRYDALLRGSIPVTVEGQGGGSMQARLPSGTAVAAGDAVVLPGIAGGMTATVSHVERAESESFVTLYMQLPANIFTLRYVEVWKQNTP